LSEDEEKLPSVTSALQIVEEAGGLVNLCNKFPTGSFGDEGIHL